MWIECADWTFKKKRFVGLVPGRRDSSRLVVVVVVVVPSNCFHLTERDKQCSPDYRRLGNREKCHRILGEEYFLVFCLPAWWWHT